MKYTILKRLAEHARVRPGACAFREVGNDAASLTYHQLRERVDSLSERLRRMAPRGAVVLLCAPNRLSIPVAFLGTMQAGMKLFPVSPRLSETELCSAADRVGPEVCIGDDRALHALRSRVVKRIAIQSVLSETSQERDRDAGGDPNDEGELYLLSSGTTSQPKIVRRGYRSLDAVAIGCADSLGLTPDDRVLAAIPLSYSYGIEHGLIAPVVAGSSVHLCDGFDLPMVMSQLTGGGMTVFPGVPAMFESLSCVGGDVDASGLSSLRCAFSAGGPMTGSILDRLSSRLNLTIGQLYGSTEVGSVTFRGPSKQEGAPANVGVPMDGVEIRIFQTEPGHESELAGKGEVGQIAVSAPSMLRGYLNDDTPIDRDGFFLTGDLGKIDGDGCLHVLGRIKLLIDIGGLKVNPLEVERVLTEYPEVAECVVVPVPVSETISRLKAIVTTRRSQGVFPIDALRGFMRDRVAPYKVPRVFEVRDQLPRLSNGKVDRQALLDVSGR